MRVFIAIPIPGEILRKIRHFRENHPELPVRWLDDHNLHITLVPPQDLNSQQLSELADSLETVSDISAFEIGFTNISIGPNAKSPRLIWATGVAPAELGLLKSTIEEAIGFRPDQRFNLHATLARMKKGDAQAIEVNEDIHWNMLVDHFVLMESKIGSTGADYSIIESYDLSE